MKFTGREELTIEHIKTIFLAGQMSKVVHKELDVNLADHEKELVREEIKELVTDNHRLYGGSDVGFFYRGQLFAIKAAFKQEGITPIHKDLEDRAQHLRDNRMDIPQYMTYIAHFLAALDSYCAGDPVTYVVNMPQGLNKFSPSLNKLEMFVQERVSLEDRASAVFQREDSTKNTFFLHYDRVDEPIRRFMFRRITH